jgi:sugar-specific transcriptional regulator TrmB
MTDPALTSQLQDLGLTTYQSEAYVAAVKAGKARPNDLVELSDVPQGRIYDVLADLESMGLVELRSGSRGKVVMAPAPEAVLEDLRERRVAALNSQIESVADGLTELYEEPAAEQGDDGYVTMARRRETALRHISRAIRTAECWLVVAVPADLYERIADDIETAIDGGVTVRLLISGAAEPPDLVYPSAIPVRFRSAVDTVVAADRRYGIYGSGHPRGTDRSYLITQEATLVHLLQDFVQNVWQASAEVQDGRTLPRWYLDPRRLIVNMADELDDDGPFTVSVEGHWTESGAEARLDGRIVDYEISGPVETDFSIAPPTIASVTVDTGERRVTVGGWRATVEDVAASKLHLRRD